MEVGCEYFVNDMVTPFECHRLAVRQVQSGWVCCESVDPVGGRFNIGVASFKRLVKTRQFELDVMSKVVRDVVG